MYIYYINVDDRQDCRDHLAKQFKLFPSFCKPVRIPAYKETNSAIGCTKSHIKCILEAKKNNLPYICVVEDNLEVTNPLTFADTLTNVKNIIDSNEIEWDVICLGGIMPESSNNTRIKDILINAENLQTTIGFIVNSKYYDIILKNYLEGLNQFQKTGDGNKYAIDQNWKHLQSKDKWFCIHPNAIKQKSMYSSIEERIINYDHFYNRSYNIKDIITKKVFYDNFIGYDPPSYLINKTFANHIQLVRVNSYEECDIHIYAYQINTQEPKFIKNSKKIHIQLSGEPEHYDPNQFDLSVGSFKTDLSRKMISLPYILQWLYYDNPTHLFNQLVTRPLRTVETIPQKFCCFIVSNPRCEVRNRFFDKMNARMKVDSWGRYKNNMGSLLPGGHSTDAFAAFISQYKFIICFENSEIDYYVSEKLLNPIRARIVPIYWGTQRATDFFNKDSFLMLEDSSDKGMDSFIKKIIDINNNDNKWLSIVNTQFINNNRFNEDLSLSTIGTEIAEFLELK
jgi:hypothetical protein